MTTVNPACTNGYVLPEDGSRPTTFTSYCGCGWAVTGFPSKTKAKAAQRAHRFPPHHPVVDFLAAGRKV